MKQRHLSSQHYELNLRLSPCKIGAPFPNSRNDKLRAIIYIFSFTVVYFAFDVAHRGRGSLIFKV